MFGNVVVLLAPSLEVGKLSLLWNARFLVFRNELCCRFLSRKDIQVISGCGCPSLDRKVVNSGKRLRAHVGVNEGDVCCHFSHLCILVKLTY